MRTGFYVLITAAGFFNMVYETMRPGYVDLRYFYPKVETDRLSVFLSENSPVTGGYFDEGVLPEYSVLANRDIGSSIVYRGMRPVIVNPVGGHSYFLKHNKDYAK